MNQPLDPVALLTGLLQRYSPSGQEEAACRYLTAQMHKLGYNAWVDGAGNAVGEIGEGPNEIVLLGHIDTVPGYINVHQEDDTLWGRGSVDAKGPLAAMVVAGAVAGAKPGWKVCVIGAVGEEEDGRGARYLCNRYHPQHLIIGEPSQWNRITLGYKGDAHFWYIVRRPVTHTAAQMESACEAAVIFWNKVHAEFEKINQDKKRTFDLVIPSLRSLSSSSDGFNETAQLALAFRMPPGQQAEDIETVLNELAGDGVVDLVRGEPAYKADKNTSLVRAFLSAIRNEGGEPSFALKSGTSDMNTVAPVWRCPTVAYGPGDSHLDHTAEEHTSLSDYQKSIHILAGVLSNLMVDAG